MASGSFKSNVCKAAGKGYYRYIEVKWKSTNNEQNNTSTISWSAYIRSPESKNNSYVLAKQIKVTIGSTTTTLIGSTATKTFIGDKIGSGTTTINHNSNGTKSVSVSISGRFYSYTSDNSTYSGNITMSPNPVYELSISAGSHTTISINRTSCPISGKKGEITAGNNKLYKGDVLKITASPSSNYKISSLTVNGSSFKNGDSKTVNSDVSVSSSAQALSSTVKATDGYIGSVSNITITKYNQDYYNSLEYVFGSEHGFITANGGVSQTEVKFNQTNIGFTIPIDFYAQIPNAKSGTCTITCRTYNSAESVSVIGSTTTCSFIARTDDNICKPYIGGNLTDVFSNTTLLTGDSRIIVRNKSNLLCTAYYSSNYYATVASLSINNYNIPSGTNTKTFYGVSDTSFTFSCVDSRGHSNSVTFSNDEPVDSPRYLPITSDTTKIPRIIPYIVLTCNPTIYRQSPSSSEILMTIRGDYYSGSFGAYNNTINIRYRYKENGGAFSNWSTISNLNISIGTNSYTSLNPISLGNNFDYRKEYIFQIIAEDGNVINGQRVFLTQVNKSILIGKGIPVFDWGEDDFNINGDLTVTDGKISILNTDSNGNTTTKASINSNGTLTITGGAAISGGLNITGSVAVNGTSLPIIKYKSVELTSVPITTQSAGGMYYVTPTYSPSSSPFNIDGIIIGLMVSGWAQAEASFVPYCTSNGVGFMSDISQTVGTIKLLVTYL